MGLVEHGLAIKWKDEREAVRMRYALSYGEGGESSRNKIFRKKFLYSIS